MSPAIPERVARLILDVQTWASARPDVLGVALVGSYARGAAKPDSDVDLVVLCEHPRAYLEDESWIWKFGTPARMAREDWGRVTAIRVWFVGGLEAEIGIADRAWASAPLDAGTRKLIEDGFVVLYDRGDAFSGIA
jgi:predicted nucleotidyltransferase